MVLYITKPTGSPFTACEMPEGFKPIKKVQMKGTRPKIKM